jgi:hypothetical protein
MEGESNIEITKDIEKQDVDAEKYLQRSLAMLLGLRDSMCHMPSPA